MREIVNAILYIQYNNFSWRLLSRDVPPCSTVYDYFRTWGRSEVCVKINQALLEQMSGKTEGMKSPSDSILNSEPVKTIKHGKQRISKRDQKAKKRKRHGLIRKMSLILIVLASVGGVIQDEESTKLIPEKIKEKFSELQLDMHRIERGSVKNAT